MVEVPQTILLTNPRQITARNLVLWGPRWQQESCGSTDFSPAEGGIILAESLVPGLPLKRPRAVG